MAQIGAPWNCPVCEEAVVGLAHDCSFSSRQDLNDLTETYSCVICGAMVVSRPRLARAAHRRWHVQQQAELERIQEEVSRLIRGRD